MIEIKISNNTEQELVVMLGVNEKETGELLQHELEELAEETFSYVITALEKEEGDDSELTYALTMLSYLMDRLIEQDNFEGAYYLALGIIHIAYTDTGIRKIGEKIAAFDNGKRIFLTYLIKVIDSFCSDMEEED